MTTNQSYPPASPFLDKLAVAPPDAREDQKVSTGTAPVSAFSKPETANPGANDAAFQPSDADVRSDIATGAFMTASPAVAVSVTGSGDVAAGGFEIGVGSRTPLIKGLS